MAIRNIRGVEDEILRKKSKEILEIDEKIKTLLADMVETMHKYEGLGLAAPQVGILKRAIVVDIYDGKGPIQLVNPIIIKSSGKQTVEEGCLSIPNKYANVVRPSDVEVESLNENGERIKIEATGIMAVVLCHEIDHLNGELFIDKMISGTLETVVENSEKEKI